MSVETYGRVQDDGTVKIYPSKSRAERAGPAEAIVVLSDDNKWIYPATGQEFKLSDVEGLSPARATRELQALLTELKIKNCIVVSHIRVRENAVTSQFNLLKSKDSSQLAWEVEQLARERLSYVLSTGTKGFDPMYNYLFVHVLRRKVTAPIVFIEDEAGKLFRGQTG